MGIKATLDQIPGLIQGKQAEIKLAANRSIVNTAELGVAKAISETSSKKKQGPGVGAVDRGLFKNSWDREIHSDQAIIRNDAPYASNVENGSRPHRIPLRILIDWVKRKRGELGVKAGDEFRVAKAIQNKIARVGIKPMFIMKDLIPLLTDELKNFIRRELIRISGK